MKQQIIVIGGGDTYDSYEEYLSYLNSYEITGLDYFKKKGWKVSLQEKMGKEFEVIVPRMPNKLNAKYEEWKIWFEKLLPLLNKEIILVGHSLGGTFLAKYLSENNVSPKIRSVFLVAPPYDAQDSDYTLGDFDLPDSLDMFANQTDTIVIYHSKDDTVAPFVDLEKYIKALPNAKAVVFEDREHFGQEEFPELVEEVKKLSKVS